jgi:hypothetical protein
MTSWGYSENNDVLFWSTVINSKSWQGSGKQYCVFVLVNSLFHYRPFFSEKKLDGAGIPKERYDVLVQRETVLYQTWENYTNRRFRLSAFHVIFFERPKYPYKSARQTASNNVLDGVASSV